MTRQIDTSKIAWGGKIGSRRPRVSILSPKPGRPVRCLLLGDILTTVIVHWYDGRTWPCLGGEADCEGCRRRSAGRKEKGYTCGCFLTSRCHCIPEITPYALRTCPALEFPENLRGQLLTLERLGERSCSPVRASLETPRSLRGSLPDIIDVKAELIRIWEAESK